MKTVLFLGYGPIAEQAIFSLKSSSQATKINVVTNSNQLNSAANFLIEEPSTWLQNTDPRTYDAVVISWKTLTGEFESERIRILQRLAISNCPRIINLSSVAVYGESNDIVTEEHLANPKNSYGKSKRQIELHTERLNLRNVINLRISNVYGNHAFDDVINRLVKNTINAQHMKVFSPTQIYRNFIDIETLNQIILNTILDKVSHLDIEGFHNINIASDESHSLSEIICLVEKVSSLHVPIEIVSPDQHTIMKSLIDNTKMKLYYNNIEFDFSNKLTNYLAKAFAMES